MPHHRSTNWRRAWLAATQATLTMLPATLLVLAFVGTTSPAAAAAGDLCTRMIEDVEFTFDPCIPEGDPLPSDVVELLAQHRICDAMPSTTHTSDPADPAAIEPSPTDSPTTEPSPTDSPTTEPSPTDPCAGWPTTGPSTEPTVPPTPVPTDTSPTDPTSPTPTDPAPTTPPAPTTQPAPTSPAPTPSTVPPTTSPTSSPTPDPCGVLAGVFTGATADPPKDAGADLIECRKKKDLPDPNKPVVLVAAGDSVTSAHIQTGYGLGRCDNTSPDFRRLPGNEATKSYAGKYFQLNKQITDYYNFARTGFSTIGMLGAKAADTDACGNKWDRTKPPVGLAEDVIAAAKKQAGTSAYFVTTGGINNTNWTDVLKEMAKCAGLETVMNSGLVPFKNKFYYVVPKVDANDPPLGRKKNIIRKGGACVAMVWVPKVIGDDLKVTRIRVDPYDGPGGDAVSADSKKIGTDAAQIATAMLNKGADKVAWMLYYDINPAQINLNEFAKALLAKEAPILEGVAGILPKNTKMSLIDPLFVPDVRAFVKAINDDLSKNLTALKNPKVSIIDPGKAAANLLLAAGDIQETAAGGSPHPNDSGHTKLCTMLDAAWK